MEGAGKECGDGHDPHLGLLSDFVGFKVLLLPQEEP